MGFVVRDPDRAVESWWKLLGVGPWHFYTYGAPLVKRKEYRGKPARYRMRLALSNIGPLRIELIQPLEGDTVYAEFVKEHGYGIHHLGLIVPDMQEAFKMAADAGLVMTIDGLGFDRDGDGHYAYLDTEDRLATTLELIQRPGGRIPPEKIYPPKGWYTQRRAGSRWLPYFSSSGWSIRWIVDVDDLGFEHVPPVGVHHLFESHLLQQIILGSIIIIGMSRIARIGTRRG